MPIYLCNHEGKKRLVKAATIAGARNHILKPATAPEITMLDAEGVADAMGEGLKLEKAGEQVPVDPPQTEPDPDKKADTSDGKDAPKGDAK